MGREIKRVSQDFDWPLRQVWEGYINPHPPIKCKGCEGTGYNMPTRFLYTTWSTPNLPAALEWFNTYSALNDPKLVPKYIQALHPFVEKLLTWREGWQYHLDEDDIKALLDAGRLWDFTRRPLTEEQVEIIKKQWRAGGNSWLPFDNGYIPTPDEVNKWARIGFGHDAANQSICVEARAKRMGFYGECEVCDGSMYYFDSEELQALHESWVSYDPPVGEGYQVWENVTEGAPVSPVFASLELLEKWLIEQGYSEGAVEQFVEQGWAYSGAITVSSDGEQRAASEIETLNLRGD